jgi:hypothetical protein
MENTLEAIERESVEAVKLGRPLKFASPEELRFKIKEYFEDYCEEGKAHPPTITGLAVFLGTSRKVLMEYEDDRPAFSNAIKKAKERIAAWTEEQLYRNTQVAGVIFNLKNNYGWKDRTETDLTSNGQPVGILFLPQRETKDSVETESRSTDASVIDQPE